MEYFIWRRKGRINWKMTRQDFTILKVIFSGIVSGLAAAGLTLRSGAADREGDQCSVQAVDSIVEMLSKENVVFHRLTGQSVQLLPPGKTNFLFVL